MVISFKDSDVLVTATVCAGTATVINVCAKIVRSKNMMKISLYLPVLSASAPAKGPAQNVVSGKIAYTMPVCVKVIPRLFIWIVIYG